jgi:peptide/nickel transport system permease protein
VAAGGLLGTALGLLAGYYEGWTGTAVLRLTDLLLALPGILLALTIVAATGPSLQNVIVAVGISSMPAYIRVVNGAVLDLKTRPFLEAVKASGAGDGRVITRHVLPNILAPVIVLSTLGLGNALLVGATLSFLGLGARPPSPEWGAMLSQGREFIFGYWWIAMFPGFAILLAVIGANLLGEGLRDLLDPRLRV